MTNLLDGLKLLVASADAPASADQAATLTTANLNMGAGTTTTASAPTVVTPTPAKDWLPDADATLRTRLVAAEAENARLRFAQIKTRAETFCRAQQDDLRVMPPEADHLVALYCVLASDDEQHGPIQLGGGKTTTRVAHLENLLASRQSRKDLTADLMGDTVAHVLTERARPRSDPNEPASAEQLAAYLNQTPTGRAALSRIAAAK